MLSRTKMILVVAMSVLFVLPMVVGTPTSLAGEKGKWKARNAWYVTSFTQVPVPDVEGHTISLIEAKGIGFIEGRGAVLATLRATSDVAEGVGTSEVYIEYTFPDGSTIVVKHDGEIKGAGGEGTWRFLKGTGKFEGITGGGTFTSAIVGPGQFYCEPEGEYSLP